MVLPLVVPLFLEITVVQSHFFKGAALVLRHCYDVVEENYFASISEELD